MRAVSIHRDVKPANLLLDEDDRVHVTDFGIASAAGDDTLTLAGTIMGTAGYLSPEQARGEPATAASDRYALGVVAYELSTGRRPFAGETPVDGRPRARERARFRARRSRRASPPVAWTPFCDARWRRIRASARRARRSSSRSCARRFHDAEPTTVAGLIVARPRVTAGRRTDVAARRRRGRLSLVPLAVVGLLGAGLAAAAFVSVDDDAPSPAHDDACRARRSCRTPRRRSPSPRPRPAEAGARRRSGGASLNDAGFELMQRGRLRRALAAPRASSLGLAGRGRSPRRTRATTSRSPASHSEGCDGVLELLDRSEDVQGSGTRSTGCGAKPTAACAGDSGKGKAGDEDDD